MERIKASLIVVQFLIPFLGEKIGEPALRKIGETLGQNALKQAGKQARNLMQLLQHKSLDTANAIKAAANSPELVEQQPEIYGIEALTAKVEEINNSDPETAAAVEALADILKSQPSIVQNQTKTAEQIGNNYQGYTVIYKQDIKQDFKL